MGVTFRGAPDAQHDVHGRPSLGSLNGSCIAHARSEGTRPLLCKARSLAASPHNLCWVPDPSCPPSTQELMAHRGHHIRDPGQGQLSLSTTPSMLLQQGHGAANVTDQRHRRR